MVIGVICGAVVHHRVAVVGNDVHARIAVSGTFDTEEVIPDLSILAREVQ